MSVKLEYSVITRLLTLNNQIYDLQHQLLRQSVPPGKFLLESKAGVPNPIAEMQQEIDRSVRASLATCWLGISDDQGR